MDDTEEARNVIKQELAQVSGLMAVYCWGGYLLNEHTGSKHGETSGRELDAKTTDARTGRAAFLFTIILLT